MQSDGVPVIPRVSVLALALAALLASGDAGAQLANEALVCPAEGPEIGPTEELRALSLALRGDIPTMDEYELVAGLGEVPEGLIDEWLAGEAFADRVVRLHRGLLWNNVANVNLVSASFSLRREPGSLLYWRQNTAVRYRGDLVPCLDEPATWTAEGALVTTEVDGAWLEGWVEVSPYWAPEESIKVCAFDAQEAEYGLSGVFCGTLAGRDDASCGCGAELRWCRYGGTHAPVAAALGAEIDQRVRALVLEDLAYTELFSSRRAFVNGPLVHYLRHQTGVFANVRFDPVALDVDTLPDLTFDQAEEWAEVQLAPSHAGVLTSPAYLLRFQTHRARANRFYDAFLCQPFNPPSGGIPIGAEELPHPDLQERAGCKYCHALLEPAAAHWGRWPESGAGWLDPWEYPREREDCVACAAYGVQCSETCNRFYLTDAMAAEEVPYLGQLDAYLFRRPEHDLHVEAGPELLVNQAIVDGRLPRCVATRAVEWLLGRAPEEDEAAWVEELALGFVVSGFRYRELVRAVVTSDTFRRVR